MIGDPRRAAVIAEAKLWIGTPFHHEGRVKGAGVDCLQILAAVYTAVGIAEVGKVPHYPADWYLHRDAERYLEGLSQYARQIEGPPEPGDIALFKHGRTFSHGAIVVEWPRVIHAYWNIGVVWGDAGLYPLKDREVKFFSPFDADA